MLCFFFLGIAFSRNIVLDVYGCFSKEAVIESRKRYKEKYDTYVKNCIDNSIFDKEYCEAYYDPNSIQHESELNSYLSSIKGNVGILEIISHDCELTIDLNNIKGKIGIVTFQERGKAAILPSSISLIKSDEYNANFDGTLNSAIKLMKNMKLSTKTSPNSDKVVSFVGNIKEKTTFLGISFCKFKIINSPLNVETFILRYSKIDSPSQKINSKYYIPDIYSSNSIDNENWINVEQYIISTVFNYNYYSVSTFQISYDNDGWWVSYSDGSALRPHYVSIAHEVLYICAQKFGVIWNKKFNIEIDYRAKKGIDLEIKDLNFSFREDFGSYATLLGKGITITATNWPENVRLPNIVMAANIMTLSYDAPDFEVTIEDIAKEILPDDDDNDNNDNNDNNNGDNSGEADNGKGTQSPKNKSNIGLIAGIVVAAIAVIIIIIVVVVIVIKNKKKSDNNSTEEAPDEEQV